MQSLQFSQAMQAPPAQLGVTSSAGAASESYQLVEEAPGLSALVATSSSGAASASRDSADMMVESPNLYKLFSSSCAKLDKGANLPATYRFSFKTDVPFVFCDVEGNTFVHPVFFGRYPELREIYLQLGETQHDLMAEHDVKYSIQPSGRDRLYNLRDLINVAIQLCRQPGELSEYALALITHHALVQLLLVNAKYRWRLIEALDCRAHSEQPCTASIIRLWLDWDSVMFGTNRTKAQLLLMRKIQPSSAKKPPIAI